MEGGGGGNAHGPQRQLLPGEFYAGQLGLRAAPASGNGPEDCAVTNVTVVTNAANPSC